MQMIKKVPERFQERGAPYERAANRVREQESESLMFSDRRQQQHPIFSGPYGGPRHPHERGLPPRMEMDMPPRLA